MKTSPTRTLSFCCIYCHTVTSAGEKNFYAGVACRAGTASFHPPRRQQWLESVPLANFLITQSTFCQLALLNWQAVNMGNCIFKYPTFCVTAFSIAALLETLGYRATLRWVDCRKYPYSWVAVKGADRWAERVQKLKYRITKLWTFGPKLQSFGFTTPGLLLWWQ